MIARLEIELSGLAPGVLRAVGRLVLANRHAFMGQIGQPEHVVANGGLDALELAFELLDPIADAAHMRHDLASVRTAALELADPLAGLVALGLQPLDLADERTTLFVAGHQPVDVDLRVTLGECLADLVGVLADEAEVEHSGTPVAKRRRTPRGYPGRR